MEEIKKRQSDTDEELEIEYKPIKCVRVLHRKREQSHDADPGTHIEFEWELSILFGPDVTYIEEVFVRLTDVSMGDCVTKERKEKIFEAFKPYCSKEFPFVNIWKRPAYKSLNSRFIQTCSKSCSVFDCTNQLVCNSKFHLKICIKRFFCNFSFLHQQEEKWLHSDFLQLY